MTLNITRGKVRKPRRDVVIGPPGVGKTTFACGGDKVLCLSYEDGVEHIGAPRIDARKEAPTWNASMKLIAQAIQEPGEWDTVVIDTLDQLELQAIDAVCAEHSKPNLAAFGYGDGAKVIMPTKWRELMFLLQTARDKGRHLILVAHVQRVSVKDPTSPTDYHTYIGAITPYNWAEVLRWADNVLFAGYDQATSDKARSFVTGKRFLKTTKGSGYEAKNRLGLPEEIPLSWSEYARYLRAPDDIRGAILSAATGELQAKAKERCDLAGDDVAKLCAIETALKKKQGESSGEATGK